MVRPHVAILVENLPVPLDRRVWQEAGALRDAGWDVTIIGPVGRADMRRWRERRDGIDIRRYPQRAASGLAGYLVEYLPSMLFTAAWLAVIATRRRIDVIHACNPPDLFWLLGRVAHVRGTRFVFDQHDANPELAASKFGHRTVKGRLLQALTRFLERRSYATSDLVIAPNDTYRQIALARGRLPEQQIVIVRNAPDVDRYRALAADATSSGAPRAAYVGVMGSQDGLDLLIDAWADVVRAPDLTSAVLELVGDGEARPRLERQVAALGLGPSVRFHGYLRPEQFVPILATCRLGVSPDPPDPFNDVSTMVKVIDYLAMGLPVVAFDLTESKHLIGPAGWIVDRADARALGATLVSALRDPDGAARLGAATQARIAELRLDWHHSAAVLVEAYERLRHGPRSDEAAPES